SRASRPGAHPSRAGVPSPAALPPTCRRCSPGSRAEARSAFRRRRDLGAEQRRDLLLGLDVGRDTRRRCGTLLPRRLAAARRRLVRAIEERIVVAHRLARRPRRAAEARVARSARGADVAALAIVVAANAIARWRAALLVELERLDLELPAEQLLDVGDEARVLARD